jgi:hypothetical protein
MHTTGLDRERKRATALYREYETILVLLGVPTTTIRPGLANTYKMLENCSKSDARRFAAEVEAKIGQLRSKYKIRAASAKILELWSALEKSPGKVFMIPLHLHREFFREHDKLFDLKSWPEHTLIELDYGTYRTASGVFELHLPEVIQYEAMCALFNLASGMRSKNNQHASKREVKTATALERATIMSAFSFVEAYLNGIARNHYHLNKDKLDSETCILLTEWDEKARRNCYVTFREKLIKYPKVILGVTHPPLQENNCPDIKFLIESAKIHRDSAVHPAPSIQMEDMAKEVAFHAIELEQVMRIVDASISVIRKIHLTIASNSTPLAWLLDRGPDGLFPDSVFT